MQKEHLEDILDKIEHAITNSKNHIKELKTTLVNEESNLIQYQIDREKIIKMLDSKSIPLKEIDERTKDIERLKAILPDLIKRV